MTKLYSESETGEFSSESGGYSTSESGEVTTSEEYISTVENNIEEASEEATPNEEAAQADTPNEEAAKADEWWSNDRGRQNQKKVNLIPFFLYLKFKYFS